MHLDQTTKLSRSWIESGRPQGATTTTATRGRRRTPRCAWALLLTAAAWWVSPGQRLAEANDLSTSPCTAGDVEIVGTGIVVNEPCVCSGGTFNATVQFRVRNNTSTGRYCIALHLIPDGSVITTSTDVILRDAPSGGSSTAPGKSGGESFHDIIMYGTIPNFPCNSPLVCFGTSGVTRGKCAPNACTTISWNTSPGNAGCTTPDQNPPGGQCRHQQVCVVGFGASLACVTSCTVTCGATGTLRACAIGPVSRGPYQLQLVGSDGSSATQSVFGDASGVSCADFTVTPGQFPTTTYTLTVTDKDGCSRTATRALTVTGSPTAGAGPDQTKCAEGATTAFTLAGTASNGTATWSVQSGPVVIAHPSQLKSGATFTGSGTAVLKLTVTNPPCPDATDLVELKVNANPTADAGPDQTKCVGEGGATSFTLAGVASNGTPTWSVVSGPAVVNNPGQLNSTVTFTGSGTATLRLTVVSTVDPPCATATSDVDLTVVPTNVTITPSSSPPCSGVLTFTASVQGRTGCSFQWTIDGAAFTEFPGHGSADEARVARTSGAGNGILEVRALDNVCHTIEVRATCADGDLVCTGSASTSFKQCVGSPTSCNR